MDLTRADAVAGGAARSRRGVPTTRGWSAVQTLDDIARWVGTPAGRGRIVPAAPPLDEWRRVRTWEASGALSTRRIRTLRLLGAGLAGTVYLVQDGAGQTYVEKHYGAVPLEGVKGLARRLVAALFALFRQAPPSFRELPQAVVAMQLINRFVVAASVARFGTAITPRVLYTRYDEGTGGYVQAFEYIEGRPLRPWQPGLPLLGEAATFRATMCRWRDFLAGELGFWGIARQVDPANANAPSNMWVTGENEVMLLDIVPGVPGFLEPRYLWWGLSRGQLPPFADAIDFTRLAAFLQRVRPQPALVWRRDLALLRAAVEDWQASEPRIIASPLRVVRLLHDAATKGATRRALLTHLEVKGAISMERAREYREALSRTGRFPMVHRHSLLKMAPLRLHLAATDRHYALRLIVTSWRWPVIFVQAAARTSRRLVDAVIGGAALLYRMLRDREERIRRCRVQVGEWIASETSLGRLSSSQGSELLEELSADEDTADIAGLFALHLLISAFKESFFGPSVGWLVLAVATGQAWLLIPALIAPTLRVAATVIVGMGSRLGLVLLCALPSVGVFAAPVHLLNKRPRLGGFIIRALAQKVALRLPALGERGAWAEMCAVAGVQVLVVEPARVLPFVFAAGALSLVAGWLWASWIAILLYALAVSWAAVRRRNPTAASPVLRG